MNSLEPSIPTPFLFLFVSSSKFTVDGTKLKVLASDYSEQGQT